MNQGNASRYHEDVALFREALTFTEATTGFSARLVEKDYFCSVLLGDLLALEHPPLVFKGGTCLSKIHAEFYRLSEDLDFSISVPTEASRSGRSKLAEPAKGHLAGLARRVPALRVIDALRGHNNSTQYIARLGYHSLVTGQEETVKVEVSVREPVLDPVERLPTRTLLMDPFRRSWAVAPFPVACLSCREAYAEKLRAALSRRDPAIRDFFDLDHGVRVGRFSPDDSALMDILRRKLAVAGNDPVDLSAGRLQALRMQCDAELAPVLRPQDLATFDIDRAFNTVSQVASRLLKEERRHESPPPSQGGHPRLHRR